MKRVLAKLILYLLLQERLTLNTQGPDYTLNLNKAKKHSLVHYIR
jgi:hypothetical protein